MSKSLPFYRDAKRVMEIEARFGNFRQGGLPSKTYKPVTVSLLLAAGPGAWNLCKAYLADEPATASMVIDRGGDLAVLEEFCAFNVVPTVIDTSLVREKSDECLEAIGVCRLHCVQVIYYHLDSGEREAFVNEDMNDRCVDLQTALRENG